MIHAHTYTFHFSTQDDKNKKKNFNNIISIVEEDNHKHNICYIQYQHKDEHNIFSRHVNVNLDRLYFLEVANIAISDEERRERLFTVIGKRCFGVNDNPVDPYLLEDINYEEVCDYVKQHHIKETQKPILFELSTHNLNRYEAFTLKFNERYFTTLKQTNISSRKTFEKIFLVQLSNFDYEKLLRLRTNELKIEFIFNTIGNIYFNSLPLNKSYFPEQDPKPEVIIQKAFKDVEETTLKHNTFLNEKSFESLRKTHDELEIVYFGILSKGMALIKEPLDVDNSYLLADAFSKFAKLLEDEDSFEKIISFIKTIKIFIQDGKISYLLHKKDSDIKDIFQYMLETFTSFNASIEENNLHNFNASALDLYHALKYFIKVYLRIYSEYKFSDTRKPQQKKKKKKNQKEKSLPEYNKTSAKDFLKDAILDNSMLDELAELDDEVKSALFKSKLNQSSRSVCIEFLEAYLKVLNTFYEFKELSYSISILIVELARYDIEDKSNKILVVLLNKLIDDLICWKDAIFIKQDAKDINYIDNSFYANVAQIDILIHDPEYENTQVEIF